MEKNFDEWNKLKKALHSSAKKIPFHEREIWWYAAGENIGIEVNGKNERFSRPILIIRKYGDEGFFGIPITSQFHSGRWYEGFVYKDRMQFALLSQARTCSVFRLYQKIGRIPSDDFYRIRDKLQANIFY